MLSKTRRFLPVFLMLFMTGLPSAQALMVRMMSLAEITDDAEKIFLGRCLSIDTELDENSIPSTYVRFRVVEAYKGVASGESVLVKQYGSHRDPLRLRDGESVIVPMKSLSVQPALYEMGKEYLLFYYPESRLGFTSPVGAGQGAFEVVMKNGVKNVMNPLQGAMGALVQLNAMTSEVQALVLRPRQP